MRTKTGRESFIFLYFFLLRGYAATIITTTAPTRCSVAVTATLPMAKVGRRLQGGSQPADLTGLWESTAARLGRVGRPSCRARRCYEVYRDPNAIDVF